MKSQHPHMNSRSHRQESTELPRQSQPRRKEQGRRVDRAHASQDDDVRRRRKIISRWRRAGVTVCTVIMGLGCVVGLLLFARPTMSVAENRMLHAYPEITAETFFDGTYFSEVALWYADTYPTREGMVEAYHRFKGLFGIPQRQGLIGGNVQADAIPVIDDSTHGGGSASPLNVQDSGAVQSESQESSTEAVQPAAGRDRPEGQTEAPDERAIAEAVQYSIMNGLYIKDGIAYSIFYFSQSGADTYIAAVNEATARLDGVSHVYSLLVPSSAVILPEDEYIGVGGSDQRQVLDYVWTRMSENATQVDILDTMQEHANDYVYFRTDHHWTMYGAYLGYVEYCRARGIKPVASDAYIYNNYGEFTGTYYWSISEIMTPYADEFEAYTPVDTNTMESWGAYEETEYDIEEIVYDSSDWDTTEKYDSLSGCDPARGLIHNPKIHDGTSCLVVKDSYGSAFIPWLVANYEYVHIIDPRYYFGSVTSYARDNKIQDVILVFGINVGLADTYAGVLYDSIVRE